MQQVHGVTCVKLMTYAAPPPLINMPPACLSGRDWVQARFRSDTLTLFPYPKIVAHNRPVKIIKRKNLHKIISRFVNYKV